MTDKRILIAGGDMRQIYCAERLSAKYDITLAGWDKELVPDGLGIVPYGKYDCLLLPVPPLAENGSISTPCFSGTLVPDELKGLLAPEAVILAGKYDKRLSSYFPDNAVVDYMEREELSLNNAVPTAEGAVQIALEELPVTLSGSKVLIAGMGRIGTALAEILKGFGAEIHTAVRNPNGAAKARIHGIKAVTANTMDSDYTVVFNTVPDMIFTRERLSRMSTATLFIDLASKPGGIDFNSAAELGIKTIWALGLPGRTAPVTAGEMIAETVELIIAERSIEHD